MALAQIAGDLSRGLPDLNIVEFSESERGFNLKLLPFQKFVLKVITKLELDDTESNIEVKDKFGEILLGTYTERDYYEYLWDHQRVSSSYDDYMNNDCIQYNLKVGRRGTKSSTIVVLSGYKLYQTLRFDDPLEYFRLLPGDKLSISLVGLGEKNAIKTHSKLCSLVQRSAFFRPFLLEGPTTNNLKVWTREDLRRRQSQLKSLRKGVSEQTNSINITAFPNSPGIRGDTNILVVGDEFAHYNKGKSSTREKPLDEEIYEALVPSISSVSNPDGTPFGIAAFISSPNGKDTLFAKQIQTSFDEGMEASSLTIQAPTWEANPRVTPKYLRKFWKDSKMLFRQEIAAEDVETGELHFDDHGVIYRAVDTGLPQAPRGRPDAEYFLGLDFALQSDATGMAACRVIRGLQCDRDIDRFVDEVRQYYTDDQLDEYLSSQKAQRNLYVFDYLKTMQAGRGEWAHRSVLLMDDVLNEVENVYRNFAIRFGMFDQWSGAVISEQISTRAIPRLRMFSHTQTINSYQYKLFKTCMEEGTIIIPNNPYMLKQLFSLKETLEGRNNIGVEAVSGGNDDLYDAMIRALFCAYLRTTEMEREAKQPASIYRNVPDLEELFSKRAIIETPYRPQSSKAALLRSESRRSDDRNPRKIMSSLKSMSRMRRGR